MNLLNQVSKSKCFEGDQLVFSHYSQVCNCNMTFAIYLPTFKRNEKIPLIWFLSGLTCTHENAMVKSGIQRWASEEKIAIIFPDTSPRGDGVPDDESFDLGQGAGFYVNSTENPWKKNFQMWSYIVDELPNLVLKEFPLDQDKQSIMGHSMGGLGALNIAFRNPEIYKTVSAFAPISNPTKGVWGQKQFEAYLGKDKEKWKKYDPSSLLNELGYKGKILVDQGTKDDFLKSLMPETLEKILKQRTNGDKIRYQKDYDHSYFFVSSFLRDHILWHKENIN
ncbi:MAG: S-formylglutathione hydrolase [Paracoccaceae bacterium]